MLSISLIIMDGRGREIERIVHLNWILSHSWHEINFQQIEREILTSGRWISTWPQPFAPCCQPEGSSREVLIANSQSTTYSDAIDSNLSMNWLDWKENNKFANIAYSSINTNEVDNFTILRIFSSYLSEFPLLTNSLQASHRAWRSSCWNY